MGRSDEAAMVGLFGVVVVVGLSLCVVCQAAAKSGEVSVVGRACWRFAVFFWDFSAPLFRHGPRSIFSKKGLSSLGSDHDYVYSSNEFFTP